MKKFFTLFFYFIFCSNSYAQTWDWARGSTGGELFDAWPVATDPSGNVFIAGAAFGAVSLGTYTGSSSSSLCIVAKYNTYGSFLWATVGNSDDATPISIATDQSGNSYLFGSLGYSISIDTFTLTNASYPNTQYFLVKLDPAGNVLWATTAGGAQIGGSVVIGIADILGVGGIATDIFGNVYITCNFSDSAVYVDTFTLTNTVVGGGSDDILLVKYDSSGNVKWAKSYGGSSNDDAYGLTETPYGDIYISGVFQSPSVVFGPSTISASADTGNAFIARFDNSGTPIWASGSGGTAGDFAEGITADVHGNVYMTGGFLDSTISFADATITNPDPGISALYLVKFDSANHVSWDKAIYDSGGNNDVWGYTVALSSCNNVWVGGAFGDVPFSTYEVNIDGHLLVAPPGGSFDPVFIAGYSVGGVYAGSAALASGADDQMGIACDHGGNIFICADYFADSPLVVGTADTLPANSTGSYNEWLYLAKYTPPFTPVAISDTVFQNIDTTICTGSIQLNGPAGYFSYLWNNDSITQNISVDSIGKYWVISEKTCVTTISIDTFKVTYKFDTLLKITDTSICKGAFVTLFSPPGYTSYLWGGGATTSSIDVLSGGPYWLLATIGCQLLSDTFKVTINPPPVVNIGNDTLVCRGDIFMISVAEPPGSRYLWSTGSTAPFIIISYPGTYFLTVTDANNCHSSDSITVTTDPIHAFFSPSHDPVCQDNPVQFTDSSITMTPTYVWNFGDGDTATVFNPVHTYPYAGSYEVYEIVTDNVPCSDTAYHTVYVDSQSGISLIVTDTVLCQGTSVTFTGIYNGQGNTGIGWNMGNGDSIQNRNPLVYAYNTSGSYTVTANALYSVCEDTATRRKVTVLPSPVLDPGGATSICPGSMPIYLSDSINAGNDKASWLWNTGQTTPVIEVVAPGHYYVIVTIDGCQSADTVWVKNGCYMDIPNAFTPNGDGVNDYFFPRQYLSGGLMSFNMNIYNRWGELIFQTSSTEGSGWDGRFNGIPQPAGVYVYMINATFTDGQKERHQGNLTLLR